MEPLVEAKGVVYYDQSSQNESNIGKRIIVFFFHLHIILKYQPRFLKLNTVNIYRYKAIGANATSSVILYTGKCISLCLEIL